MIKISFQWKQFCIFLLILSGMLPASAGGSGTTAADFLVIFADARPSAVGGAFTALADNAAGLAFNPAGLTRPDFKEITATYVDWFEDASFQHVSLTYPRGGGDDAFGISILYFNPGSFKLTDELGVPQDRTLRAGDIAATFGYGRQLRPELSWGISGKYIYRELDDVTAQTFAVDLGVQYHPLRNGLTVAGTIQNLGGDIKFIQESEPLPLTFRAGVSWPILLDRINLLGDLIKVEDEDVKYAAGVEYHVLDALTLRAGWRNEEGLMRGGSAGFGLRIKSLIFDYAYVPFEIFGATHRITGTFRFAEPTQPAVRRVPRDSPFPDRAPEQTTRTPRAKPSSSSPESPPAARTPAPPRPIRSRIERPPVRIRGAEQL